MAFPSGVPRYAQPTGIWLAAVPPSSETVDIELWWKTTGSTSFSWLATMQQSGRLGGPGYSFVHDLPLTTESHTYKARSVANGKLPSTFTAEVTRRPVPLPQMAFGQQTPVEPVLGVQLPIVVAGAEFKGDTSTQPLRIANASLSCVGAASADATATVSLAPGLVINTIDVTGRTNGAGSGIEVSFKYADDAETVTSLVTIALGNTSDVVSTIPSTNMNHTVTVGRRYFVTATLTSTGSGLGRSDLMASVLRYTPNSYTQVRS